MRTLKDAWEGWLDLFAEDDPRAPRYDPVHLGAVLVACQAAIGALYWLLWTLLVYEGGLASKLRALTSGAKSPDAYEGWPANLAALLLTAAGFAALRRLERGPRTGR